MRTSFKEINRLAIPAIIAGVAEPLIGMADTALIGHVGVLEQGAIGNGSQLYVFLLWVLAQSKTAISAIVSRNFGEKNTGELKHLIPLSILTMFGLGTIVAIASGFLTNPILQFFYNMDGSLLSLSSEYYQIRAIGFPLTLTTFGIFGIFRGLQNTSWAMSISIIGALVNVGLDYIFIYGLEDIIPPMSVAGAAWASVLSQALMLLLTIIYLVRKTNYGIIPKTWKHPEMKHFWNMLGHLTIRTIALNIAFILSNRYATSYGEHVIAAHAIAMQIWLFFAFFIDGYSNAGNAIAGKLLGEGNIQGLRWLAKDVTRASILIAVGIATCLGFAYPWIPYLFTDNEFVAQTFKSFFWLVLICQPVNGVSFSYDGIFKGLGEAKLLRNVLLFATFIGFIPFILLLDYFNASISGVWISLIVWMGFRASPLVWVFNKRFNKK